VEVGEDELVVAVAMVDDDDDDDKAKRGGPGAGPGPVCQHSRKACGGMTQYSFGLTSRECL
jgi:hypothetical protein